MHRSTTNQHQRTLPFPLQSKSVEGLKALPPVKIKNRPGKTMTVAVLRAQTRTWRQAIRQNCIDCAGGVSNIENCQGDKLLGGPCLFYPHRMSKNKPSARLIRKHCLWCMGKSKMLVRECPSKSCPFLPWRMRHVPKPKSQNLSDKQLKSLAEGTSVLNRRKGPLCPVISLPESAQIPIECKTIGAIPAAKIR